MLKLNSSQSGVVSILVTLIMMIVITFIVVGFGQLARNEVKQALNRQLSLEAYYAANSAMNNAASIVKHDIQTGAAVVGQTGSCSADDNGGNLYSSNSSLNSSDVQYSCVIVNPAPTSVDASIADGSFYVVPIQVSAANNVAINSIKLSWHKPHLPTGAISCQWPPGSFPSNATWSANCPGGVLRVDVLPDMPGASDTLANMEQSTKTIFIYPNTLGNFTGLKVDYALCTSTGCSVTLGASDLPQAGTATRYYLRVMSLYEDSELTITAASALSPRSQLYDAQVQIDATGRAQDVLQRLSGRLDINNPGGVPFAVQTGGSLCKTIEGYPGYIDTNVNGITYTSGTVSGLNGGTDYSCSWQ